MTLSAAVWVLIVCAVAMANLPFLLDRPLAPWPWARGSAGGATLRGLRSLAFLAGVALWAWGTLTLLGRMLIGGLAQSAFGLLVCLALAALLLALPGLRSAAPATTAAQAAPASVKPFFDRLLEVLVGYAMVGCLGFALELKLGNAFPQRWEFYAVTLALFLVLGFPGFVWRYMLRRRSR